MHCLLCRNPRTIRVEFPDVPESFLWHCGACDFLFKDSSLRLDEGAERARYDLHQNGDEGHRRFLAPVAESVSRHLAAGARGIDWGSGPVPVLRELLEARGFRMDHYDPFFAPEKPAPGGTYDFVTLTEVIEHVHEPALLMEELRERLNPGGRIFVMTDPAPERSRLATWGYRRDPTHVAFFNEQTFRRFDELFGLRLEAASGRIFVLRAPVKGLAVR